DLFICPTDGLRAWRGSPRQAIPASTSYLGVSGKNDYRHDGLLFLSSRIRLTDVTDGTSSTLTAGERPPGLQQWFGRWYGSWGPWGIANGYLGVIETGVSDSYNGC